MQPEFWRARWAEGRIGFHEGRPNALLEDHVDRLGQAQRVLVPLCGKSEDLAFLAAAGHQVIGVELVEDAVRAFFAEHGLTPEVSEEGPLLRYRAAQGAGAAKNFPAESITIWVGDFFDTTPAALGEPSAFYDRAALVALPAEVRPRYVAHLRALCRPGAGSSRRADEPVRGLVLTYEYDPASFEGPPFAIPEEALRSLHAGAEVEPLSPPLPAQAPRFAEQGIPVYERLYGVAL